MWDCPSSALRVCTRPARCRCVRLQSQLENRCTGGEALTPKLGRTSGWKRKAAVILPVFQAPLPRGLASWELTGLFQSSPRAQGHQVQTAKSKTGYCSLPRLLSSAPPSQDPATPQAARAPSLTFGRMEQRNSSSVKGLASEAYAGALIAFFNFQKYF